MIGASALLVLVVWLANREAAIQDDDPTHVIPDPGEDAVSFHMFEVNNSGQTGAATLDPREDGTLVVIKLTAPTDAAQPVHLHVGTCDDRGPIAYELNSLDPNREPDVGFSETVVDADLIDGERPLALVVQTAPWDERVRACGDLPGPAGEAAG